MGARRRTVIGDERQAALTGQTGWRCWRWRREEDDEGEKHQSPFTWKPERKTTSIDMPVGISMTG